MKNWLTIITTCLNEETNILKHLNHLKNLSEIGIEIILIDGGSTDRTLNIIDQFNCDKIKIFTYNKLSIYQAFNVGINESSTNYLSFLGVGDILNLDFLIEVKKNINSFQYDIIYGDLLYYNTKKNYKYNFRSIDCIREINIKNFPFSHSGSIQKKDLFIKYGNFDDNYIIASDYEWLCRVVTRKSLIAKKINTIQSKMSLGGFSTSEKYYKTLYDETSRIRSNYNISTSYKTRIIRLIYFLKRLKRKILN
jgi:glycosyltransferase involved in cell wall biosynthesis